MKRLHKIMLGATLLEIMLVLAIAAMIIIMSVRYYQSASVTSQTNAVLSQIQAIAAAADNIAQSSNTYTAATKTALEAILSTSAFTSPWGTTISYVPSTNTYAVSIASTPAGVCPLITPKLQENNHFTSVSCTGGGALSYTYSMAPTAAAP